jgi:hypothetical protein
MPFYGKKTKTRTVKRMPKKATVVKYGKKKKLVVDYVVDRTIKHLAYSSTTTIGGPFIGNDKNALSTSNFAFRLSLIPGLAPYVSTYTHYRVNHVKIQFIPTTVDMQVEDNDNGTSASGIYKQTPLFYCKRIWGNEDPADMAYTTEDQCLLDGARPVKMTKGFTISFVPSALAAIATTRSSSDLGGPALRAEQKKWYSLADTDILFYGIKYLISTTTSDVNEFCYRAILTWNLSFKGINDTFTGNIAGSGVTVVLPIPSAV